MDAALFSTGMIQSGPNKPAALRAAEPLQSKEDASLLEKCLEFESLLYAELLHAMRETVEKSPLFHGGRAEEIYTSLLDNEYAKVMATSMQKGIAEALYQQLKRPRDIGPKDTEGGNTYHVQTNRAALVRKGG